MARRFAVVACALALLLVPSFVVGGGGGPHHNLGLTGNWLVTIDFPGYDSFRYLWTFTADGNSVAPLPLLGPGYEDTRIGCVGPWKRTGRRTYQVTLYCLDSQALEGETAIFNRGRFDVTLARDGNSWTDPSFKFEWWIGHPSDGEYLGYGHGAATAELLPNVKKD